MSSTPPLSATDINTKPRKWLGVSVAAWITLGVSITVVLIVFMSDCNSITQSINMRAARQHIDAIAPRVLSAPGREQVTMSDYTGGRCGAIMVTGTVRDAAAATSLRDDIAATRPPTEVLFNVYSGAGEFPMWIQVDPIPAAK
ncbi:MAG TPA: hypothetical protein VD971_07845 [Phycisphaerales bacterium]|nr:hypothetical protein [Phycisphaerales bacterium]